MRRLTFLYRQKTCVGIPNATARHIQGNRKGKQMTEAAIGHNSEAVTQFSRDQLKAVIERVERLEEEKKTISDDIRDIYAEAKGNGYDVKALRTIVRMRKQDASERSEQEAVLETYMIALGMI